MKFGFVAKHRGTWPLAMMCEAIGVSRSGFYAWLSRPRGQRSLEDEVLGSLVRQSFLSSDRTYGLGACGMTCWHWVSDADCTALSGSCVSRPCARGRDVEACRRTEASAALSPTTCWTASPGWCAQPEVGGRLHVHPDGRGLAICRCGTRPVLASHRRLVDAGQHDHAARCRCADDGSVAPGQAGRVAASL